MKKTNVIRRAALKIAALSCILSVSASMLSPMNAARAQNGTAAATTPPTTTDAPRAPRTRMTPAQREAASAAREAARSERAEKALRTALSRGGVADMATQDAVIDYQKSEMTARQESSKATAKVMQALRTGAVTDSQFNVLLNEMRDAAAQERARRTSSAATLDTKIGYTKKPRLEAILVLSGLVGDEAMTLSATLPAMPSAGRGRRRAYGAAGEAAAPTRRTRRNADAPAAAPNAMPAP